MTQFQIIHPLSGKSLIVSEATFNEYSAMPHSERERHWARLTVLHAKDQVAKPVEPEVALSVEATIAQRGSRYGDFTDHARLCQQFKDTATGFIPGNWTTSTPWAELDPVKKQALEVIFDKIARILSGDPNYDDNWHDIQGYAKLVEDRLPKKES